MKTWTMTTFSIALAAGCAIDPPGTSVIEQSTVAPYPGCALDLAAETYVECLRSTYAVRCESGASPDDIWCLGVQHLNDLSNEDIITELGLQCDPMPQPVPGACWQDAAADFGCALDLDAAAHVACIRGAYVARCEGGALLGGIWCLGHEYLNDLSNDDIIAELGLLEPSPEPAPHTPVPAPESVTPLAPAPGAGLDRRAPAPAGR